MARQPQPMNMEFIEQVATGPRPIPGQSLTNSPDAPLPFEGPTKFVELQPALDHLFIQLTEDGALKNLEGLLSQKYPVSLIAEQLLFAGFTEGLWNPDLMLLLLEPTIYMILSIADRLGIKDIVIDENETPDEYGEEADPETKVRKMQDATKAFIKAKTMKGQMSKMTAPREEAPAEAPVQQEQKIRSLLSREEG